MGTFKMFTNLMVNLQIELLLGKRQFELEILDESIDYLEKLRRRNFAERMALAVFHLWKRTGEKDIVVAMNMIEKLCESFFATQLRNQMRRQQYKLRRKK